MVNKKVQVLYYNKEEIKRIVISKQHEQLVKACRFYPKWSQIRELVESEVPEEIVERIKHERKKESTRKSKEKSRKPCVLVELSHLAIRKMEMEREAEISKEAEKQAQKTAERQKEVDVLKSKRELEHHQKKSTSELFKQANNFFLYE